MRWARMWHVYGREEVHTEFLLGNLKERGHLEDGGLDGRLILRWIFRKWDGGMEWFELVQDKDGWRALVNAVINLRVPKNAGNFLTS
jgi:hypothetical protein